MLKSQSLYLGRWLESIQAKDTFMDCGSSVCAFSINLGRSADQMLSWIRSGILHTHGLGQSRSKIFWEKNIPWRFQKVKLEFVAHCNSLQGIYIVRDCKVSKKYTRACVWVISFYVGNIILCRGLELLQVFWGVPGTNASWIPRANYADVLGKV